MKAQWNLSSGIQKLILEHSHTMKNRTYKSLFLSVVFLAGCSAPSYLPSVEEIDINQYGSYIEIEDARGNFLKGELIAIDSAKLVVLSGADSIKLASIIQLNEVNRFTLKYAQPQDYSWRIPVYTISTLLHGYFLLITAPINLIVTTVVNASGSTDFEYSDNDITFEKLKMFARFPQGLPSVIKITDLK